MDAVVLEAIQSNPLDPWMEERLSQNREVAKQIIGEPMEAFFPDQGVAVRTADFIM